MPQNPDWQIIAFFALVGWIVLVIGVLIGLAIWRNEIKTGETNDD